MKGTKMNIDNLNVVELETLLANVKQEIQNRKDSAKQAKIDQRNAKKAVRQEAKFARIQKQEARKIEIAQKTAIRIAAVEAKLEKARAKVKALMPVTTAQLKSKGAAVTAKR